MVLTLIDVRPEIEASIRNITDKLTPKAKHRIAEAAAEIASQPQRAQVVVHKFLRMHLEEDSAIFLKMLREIVASMEITWKAYRNFDPEIRQREFEQYCSRIFMGSWLAIRNLPKTQFAATPQAPHNAA